MKKDNTYNGHKNYNYWNVNLHIWNDYGLCKSVEQMERQKISKDRITNILYSVLKDSKTSDGVKYSKSAIRAALVGR